MGVPTHAMASAISKCIFAPQAPRGEVHVLTRFRNEDHASLNRDEVRRLIAERDRRTYVPLRPKWARGAACKTNRAGDVIARPRGRPVRVVKLAVCLSRR